MVMRVLRFRPGIEPRTPIWLGWSVVSHTFTVAHGSTACLPCAGAAARSAATSAMRMVRRICLVRTVSDRGKFL